MCKLYVVNEYVQESCLGWELQSYLNPLQQTLFGILRSRKERYSFTRSNEPTPLSRDEIPHQLDQLCRLVFVNG